MKKILIICPLAIEHESLCETFEGYGYLSETLDFGPIKVTRFPELGFYCALGGHGKTQFGIQTQYLISKLENIDAILCAGAAGGIKKGVTIFDLVVAEKTIEHDYLLRFIQRPLPEFIGDSRVLNKLKNISSGPYNIHFGILASGDEDIIDPIRAEQLAAATGAWAVAWEGAGGARAAKFNNIPFAEIRAITDTSDNQAPADFYANVRIACKNLADFLIKAAHEI